MVGLPYESMRSAFDTMHAFENLYRVYNDPSRRGDRNRTQYRLSSYPIVGDYLRSRDSERYLTDYMNQRGLSWDDVKYPSLLKGSTLGYRTFETSMKSLERLYR